MDDWRRWLFRLSAAAGLVLLAYVFSRPGGSEYAVINGEAFATHTRIVYAGRADQAKVRQAVEAELDRIDAMVSTWRDDSELMRLNRSDDPARFDLSPDLAGLIKRAEQIEQETAGAFSPRPRGQAFDLSGIAKGYAVDRLVALLQREFGFTACLVDVGGEVRVLGDGPKGDGWRVGVYLPEVASEMGSLVLNLHDTSVATSGHYFNAGHILDPATGRPVSSGLISVSVIHPSNTTADALATALYVMGAERGVRWAEDNGVWAVFVLDDGSRVETRVEP